MKKLFSIVLAIAIAVSCFAISASAAETIEGDYTFTHKIEGDVLTLTFAVDAMMYDMPASNDLILDWWMEYDPADLVYMGDETIVATGVEKGEIGVDIYTDSGDGYTSLGLMPVIYEGDAAARDYTASVSAQWKILAEAGSTVEIPVVEVSSGSFDARVWGPTSYTFVYEDTDAPETDAPETEPEVPVLPEAPAVAEYQELAGCEACGIEAGVRFKAIVSGDTDNFGMKITGNNRTFDLNSKSEGFKSVETDNGIEFTAVIFTTVVDFTVVVYETYAEGTVESAGTTNA